MQKRAVLDEVQTVLEEAEINEVQPGSFALANDASVCMYSLA